MIGLSRVLKSSAILCLVGFLLAGCSKSPEISELPSTERKRLNRGIVELTQRLQDTELELEQVRTELAAAQAQIADLGGVDSADSPELAPAPTPE